MEKSLLKAYIKNIISESLTPDQVNKVEDKYNSIYSGMLKGNKKKLMKYVDPKFNRPNPDAMAMGRAINLVKKETETVNESFSQEDWDIKWKMPKDNLFNVTKTTDAVNNRYKALQSLLKSKPEELRVFDADENHPAYDMSYDELMKWYNELTESVNEGDLDQTLVGTVEPKDRGTEPYMAGDGSIIIQDRVKAKEFFTLATQAGIPIKKFPSGIMYIARRDKDGNLVKGGKEMARELFNNFIGKTTRAQQDRADWKRMAGLEEVVKGDDFRFIEIKDLHFETDPDRLEDMKIEFGAKMGGITPREKIEDAEYELRRFRKSIGFGDGSYSGVFLPGTYDAINSKLGDGPHAKKVSTPKWNERKYEQWIEDVASGGGAEFAYDMAQNAKMEAGLIDWVKKNRLDFGDVTPLERIQYDIEALAESINEANPTWTTSPSQTGARGTIDTHTKLPKLKEKEFYEVGDIVEFPYGYSTHAGIVRDVDKRGNEDYYNWDYTVQMRGDEYKPGSRNYHDDEWNGYVSYPAGHKVYGEITPESYPKESLNENLVAAIAGMVASTNAMLGSPFERGLDGELSFSIGTAFKNFINDFKIRRIVKRLIKDPEIIDLVNKHTNVDKDNKVISYSNLKGIQNILKNKLKPNEMKYLKIGWGPHLRKAMKLNERLSSMVREVYSEKQRKWACAQDNPKFDEMCKDTAISKKKKMEEEVTDKEEKKLEKISKELNKASKMHKGQADRISKIVKETGMGKAKKNMDTYKDKNRLEELIKTALKGPIKEKEESFPDLTGDGKVTKADILKGRGVKLEEGTDLVDKHGYQFTRFSMGEEGPGLQITGQDGNYITIPGSKLGFFASALTDAIRVFDDMSRQLPVDENEPEDDMHDDPGDIRIDHDYYTENLKERILKELRK
jgi:hypothetical protein